MIHRKRSRLTSAVGALLLFAATAAACSEADDDGDGAAPPEEGSTGVSAAPTDARNQNNAVTEGEPVRGGDLVFGLEADTANPWAPYRASYAPASYVVLSAISDSLFAVTEKGETVPLLAESVSHNKAYTEWTITIRKGIKFHDGTPLDADAVKFNIETCVGSPLTAAALSAVGPITARGQTVTIKTKGGPWVALPGYFTYGSCGYMLSKKWLESLPDVPHRVEGNPFYDATLAATPANGDPAKPVGLGAFVFESYRPGNGNSFKAVRNEDYWRGPNGITGEQLPYLDSVEGVVAVDIDSRANALRSAQFDMIHTRSADAVADFREDEAFETASSDRYGETGYVLLNVAEGTNSMTGQPLDPEGTNTGNPLVTLSCRRALAYAVDTERLAEERGAGIVQPANGPFPPGSMGYLEDTGYPDFDVDAAQTEMDKCLKEQGTDHIEFDYNTTNDPFNVETNTLVISMWKEAFGDRVRANITPIEQGQYIGLALTGDFEAFAWSNHSGRDPDQQLLWWISASAAPIGQQALNFGRFTDDVIDEALITIRTNPDQAARKDAAETISKRFGSQVYNLWMSWALSSVITQPYVNDQVTNTLPDGTEGLERTFTGQVNQIWCEGGRCE